ncbi:Crp/Fnr family transcriptional regulator [Cloacibacterium sp.]|uniref:Crp/Fnr family transcriptional regulator n=1 Tax=Cloacibacterium sp. TaxID=1913682 RepID=UPI0035AD86BD
MEIAVQLYLNSYKKISPELTDEELEFVKSNISILKLKKKQILIHENEIQKSIAFIYSGLIRSYFIDENGKEINNAFFSENEFVTDYLSFIKQQKTKYTFECLEDCILISIPFETVEIAFDKYKNFANFGRKIAEWALENRTKKYESFLFETAEERYLRFIAENRPILNRISLSHLASYLGIERQSLSRIRSKILSQM